MNLEARNAWIRERVERSVDTKALLTVIAADGVDGSAGVVSDTTPGGRRPMTPRMAQELLDLVNTAGVQGAPGRLYLARLLRWHWGYETGSGTIPPNGLHANDAAFIRRRAFELANQARHYMPELINDRPAT